MHIRTRILTVAMAIVASGTPALSQCEPALLGQLELLDDPRGVASMGNFSFVTAGSTGVRVVDMSDPASPVVVATIDTPGTAQDIAAAGGMLFVADGPGGLEIYGLADPLNPEPLGSLAFADGGAVDMVGIAMDGTTAYMIDSITGLRVVDVSDPGEPVQTGQDPDVPDTMLRASKVAVSGDTAVVSYLRFHPNGEPGVRLLNIASSPVPVGWVGIPGEPSGIALRGDSLFVGDFIGAQLRAYDASDASSPIPVGMTPVEQIVDLAVDGGELFVLTRNGGLRLIDALSPSTLPELGSITTPDNATSVGVSGSTALIADGGLSVPFDRVPHLSLVAVGPCQAGCPADFTGEGVLDIFDVFGYLNAFSTGSSAADFTGDGSLDIFDVFAFLDAFGAGCP